MAMAALQGPEPDGCGWGREGEARKLTATPDCLFRSQAAKEPMGLAGGLERVF